MSRNNKRKPVKAPARKSPAPKVVTATPVRNSAIPKVAPKAAARSAMVAPQAITHEMIARRAFEISCGPNCGSELDNWYRAERELRG